MPTILSITPFSPAVTMADVPVGEICQRIVDNQFFLKTAKTITYPESPEVTNYACVSLKNYVVHHIRPDTRVRLVAKTTIIIKMQPGE